MIHRALIFSLFLVSPCLAGTVLLGTNGTSNMIVSDPVAVGNGSENLLQVTVSIDSLVVATPGGFDGSFSGPFHQQDVFGAVISPTLDNVLGDGTNVSSATDTHFLVLSANLIAIVTPTENINQAPSAEPAFGASGSSTGSTMTSFGSSISGTFALTTGAIDPLPLAQLVVPDGSTVNYTFTSSFDGGVPAPESFAGSFAVTSVAEPTPGDFNDDSLLTDTDIDLLSAAVGSSDIMFDLDGNGTVEEEDRRIWVEEVLGTFFGDADLNQEVAFADFLALSSNFGLDGAWAKGDFDGSGTVLFPDFLLLASNFGKSATTVATVPEPNAAMLFIVGLVCLVRRRSIVSKNAWPR